MKVNNPDTLVAVSAYAGDAGQVENNLPYYLHHGCPVVVFSPADAPITEVSDRRVHCQWAGEKGWIGPQTLRRHKIYLQMLLKFPHKHFLFHDADSICLDAQIPEYCYRDPDVIWSNEVRDTNPAHSLLPKLALQPPYFLSRNNIEGMLRCADNPPHSYTEKSPEGWSMPIPTECIDHYMLQIAHGSGFPHLSFHSGASFETVTSNGLEQMSILVRHHGKNMLHSVKSFSSLHRLVNSYSLYKRGSLR